MRARRRRPTPRAAQCPGLGRREELERAEWRRAAWVLFWLLALGKLAIMLALAAVALRTRHPAGASWGALALLNWSWLLLAALLLAAPLARAYRLRRVRRKRAALIRAEWLVE